MSENTPSKDILKVRATPKPPASDVLPHVRNVVLVGAGKGGVGKSTCAVNLALALKHRGASVGLLDADFYGPSMPLMLGLTGQKPVPTPSGKMAPLVAHGLKVMSLGFLVDPEQAVIWRGPMLHGAVGQLFRDVDWGELDYLIVDLPPGTGDIPLSISQVVKPVGAVLVTTPQDISLADVRKAKTLFDKVRIPVLGLIENMSGFVCPHCQTATPIFDQGGGKRAAEAMKVPLLGTVPLDPVVCASGDEGVPLMERTPQAPQAPIFSAMAKLLAEEVARKRPLPCAKPSLSLR